MSSFVTPPETDRSAPYCINRYEVPIDGEWHPLVLSGGIVLVGNRVPTLLEFWALCTGDELYGVTRKFRVFGTGQSFPADHRLSIVGTTVGQGQYGLVWHLVEMK